VCVVVAGDPKSMKTKKKDQDRKERAHIVRQCQRCAHDAAHVFGFSSFAAVVQNLRRAIVRVELGAAHSLLGSSAHQQLWPWNTSRAIALHATMLPMVSTNNNLLQNR
jgi:hypothetical protein